MYNFYFDWILQSRLQLSGLLTFGKRKKPHKKCLLILALILLAKLWHKIVYYYYLYKQKDISMVIIEILMPDISHYNHKLWCILVEQTKTIVA